MRTTGKGVDETGLEIGKVGTDSYKVTKGTVTKIDEGNNRSSSRPADGTEKTFEHTDNAGKDVGTAVGKGTAKGAKVTVYYTEESEKKVAHFSDSSPAWSKPDANGIDKESVISGN
ncbi:MAG: hypothetical protein WA197_16235 [Candidatus Acidiferrales bacterium]